jgi:hypothetical protein
VRRRGIREEWGVNIGGPGNEFEQTAESGVAVGHPFEENIRLLVDDRHAQPFRGASRRRGPQVRRSKDQPTAGLPETDDYQMRIPLLRSSIVVERGISNQETRDAQLGYIEGIQPEHGCLGGPNGELLQEPPHVGVDDVHEAIQRLAAIEVDLIMSGRRHGDVETVITTRGDEIPRALDPGAKEHVRLRGVARDDDYPLTPGLLDAGLRGIRFDHHDLIAMPSEPHRKSPPAPAETADQHMVPGEPDPDSIDMIPKNRKEHAEGSPDGDYPSQPSRQLELDRQRRIRGYPGCEDPNRQIETVEEAFGMGELIPLVTPIAEDQRNDREEADDDPAILLERAANIPEPSRSQAPPPPTSILSTRIAHLPKTRMHRTSTPDVTPHQGLCESFGALDGPWARHNYARAVPPASHTWFGLVDDITGEGFVEGDQLETHCGIVVAQLQAGKVIPFFGAGVNMCGRLPGQSFEPGRNLPASAELAQSIADQFGADDSVPHHDLLAVAQWVELMIGPQDLYDYLHVLLDWDYTPTTLHAFFARLPRVLRDKGHGTGSQIIVTTNYDDVLERAFEAEGEPFDLVSYIAEGDNRGKFWHRPSGEQPRLIERPNEYTGLSLDTRSLIVKIHGEVNRRHGEHDSYVISEDDYIDYLARTDLNNLIPPTLLERLQRAHFLFLGYSLRDWNLRVILHRIAASRIMPSKSWAIMRDPADLDKEFWGSRDVKIFDAPLEHYIEALDDRLRSSAPSPSPSPAPA